MNPDLYTYETKCRRCGELTEWAFQKVTKDSIHDWIKWKIAKSEFPSEYQCETCQKKTLQDVVSFSE